ncbi:MAG: DUF4238 domain-containing protein [Geminicoccaceae bacterium]|nr:DUF4238 domain-containing protein [Geminicoccaceae bacterium]
MSVPRKHHYVPKFLIEQWANKDGSVAPYLRTPLGEIVQEKGKGAKAFCCELDLFTLQMKEPKLKQQIESGWFSRIDSDAAKIHAKLVQDADVLLSDTDKCAWMRFVCSLLIRQPSLVRQTRQKIPQNYRDGLNQDWELIDALKQAGINQTPAEFAEAEQVDRFENRAMILLAHMCDNPKEMAKFAAMQWCYGDLKDAGLELVLSDRPVIKILTDPRTPSLLTLPLSPTRIWFAACNRETLENIKALPPRDLVERVNHESVRQATKWVFDRDGHNLRSIQKHLKAPPRATA